MVNSYIHLYFKSYGNLTECLRTRAFLIKDKGIVGQHNYPDLGGELKGFRIIESTLHILNFNFSCLCTLQQKVRMGTR